MRGRVHRLAAPYALDALDGWELRRFEAHLGRCAACAAEVARLRQDAARLGAAVAAEPPPALRERVLTAIRTTPQTPPPAPAAPGQAAGDPASTSPAPAAGGPAVGPARHPASSAGAPARTPPHAAGDPASTSPAPAAGAPASTPPPAAGDPVPAGSAPWGVRLVAAGGVLSLVAAVLFAVLWVRTADDLDRERSDARAVREVLAAPDAAAEAARTADGGRINAVVSRDLRRAVVTVSGLPAPGPGRVYQLWAMDDPPEAVRSAGLLRTGEPFLATGLAPDVEQLAVTEEPAGGSGRPTGEPVLRLALDG